MKTVILCGGRGTRISEESQTRPKPMVEIGHRPILWHIMKLYAAYGQREFVLALGYKADLIKDYFLHYHARQSDLTLDLASGRAEYRNPSAEDWKVHLVDTGENTLTGGRLLRLEPQLRQEGTFLLTYGDGVADIDLARLIDFHRRHGKLVTVTAVRPSARFGGLQIQAGRVTQFREKPKSGEGWINGGFFVMEPAIFGYLKNDQTILEQEPLETLAKNGQLMAYEHGGYWQCMDNLRDRVALEEAWASGQAPWKKW